MVDRDASGRPYPSAEMLGRGSATRVVRAVAAFSILTAASLSCVEREERPTPTEAPRGAEPAAGESLSVESITSVSGDTGGLLAKGDEGERALAPGDAAAPGETVRASEGIEAVLGGRGGAVVVLHEGAEILLAPRGGSGISVARGDVSLSRPVGAARGFEVRLGASEVSLSSGRVTARWNGAEGGSFRVDTGVAVLDGGQRIPAGHEARLDQGGRVEVSPAVGAASTAFTQARIRSLAPEIAAGPVVEGVVRGIGTLTARAPGSGHESEWALDLAEHLVDVSLRDGVALTRIEEVFENRSGRTVEGTYRFLIPAGASITRLALEIDGRIEEGEVLDKKRARRIFKRIVEDSVRPRDPALLEWKRGSSYEMKIYPIRPGERRRVFVSYMEEMTARDGRLRYVYPMGGSSGAPRVGRFALEASIDSSLGVEHVRTPLYPSRIEMGERGADLSFEAIGFAPVADFVLEYALEERPGEMRVASQTEKNGETYAMFLLDPPVAASSGTGVPDRVVAVVDTSYGIGEEVRALAHATALELLASLDPETDAFQVLACDSGCRAMSESFEAPTPEALGRAHGFLSGIAPGGASDLLGAIESAFSLVRDGGPGAIVYIGDGVPTSGERDAGRLARLLREVRPEGVSLHAVGVGPDVDAVLLDALSSELGGSSHHLSVGEPPAAAAFAVACRIRSPGLRDVSFEWPPGVESAHPARIGFAPAGEEIAVVARISRPEVRGDAILRAVTSDGREIERTYPVEIRSGRGEPGFVARLWAKHQIDSLSLRGGSDREIVDLSRRMRVASRLTSWIVLENERMYERFGVQRTDAEEWDGAGAEFADVDALSEDEEEVALDDALADEDLESASGNLGVLGGAVGGGGGYGRGAGAKKGEAAAETIAAAPAAARRSKSAASPKSPKSRVATAADRSKEEAAEKTSAIAGAEIARQALGTEFPRPDPCASGPTYEIRIGRPTVVGGAHRVADLATRVRENPLSRKNHRRYVRLLARLGRVDEALAAAETWREADPLGAGALASLADQIARTGRRIDALRTYAGIAEIGRGSNKVHLRLARAFADLGLYEAAAGHFCAASEKDADAALEYLFCLAASGRGEILLAEARRISAERAMRGIRDDVSRLVAASESGVLPPWPRRRARGELTVRATLRGAAADVDLSAIDPAGARLSGLWRRGASVSGFGQSDGETLGVHSLRNGRYLILVSRSEATPEGPVSGDLVIRCRNERRTIPFRLVGDDVVVAEVRYKRKDPPTYCR